MFSTLYNTFLDFLSYLYPLWESLTTPISSLPIFQPSGSGDWWWSVLFPWVNWLPNIGEAVSNYFGDITLLQFVLGGSIMLLVFAYVFKFFKGFII